MHGRQRPRFRPGGGASQPPSQPPAPQLNPNIPFQNPNFYFQNPAFQLLQNLANVPLQNPNFLPQNPNFPLQNPSFPIQNSNLPHQQTPPDPSNPAPQPRQSQSGSQSTPQSQKPTKEGLARIDRAVVKARREIIAAGESVNAWKVCQSVSLMLKVDSWSSLGFQMQEVPSLNKLMVTEAKVNAFIHCFSGVERITSLYDLEKSLCKSEGVEKFDELELGPFLKHPLILHYFSVNSDVTEVCKISSSDIIVSLCEYLDAQKKNEVEVGEFLEILAKKRLLSSKETLGVRIQNIRMYTRFIREARRSEDVTLKKFWLGLQPDHKRQKRPIFTSHRKKQLDDRFSALCERVKSFSAVNEEFCGKHIRFVTSSSEDEESDDCSSEDQNDTDSDIQVSSQVSGSDWFSRCPYPSATEEIKRLGLKGETSGQPLPAGGGSRKNEDITKKRKFEKITTDISTPTRSPKKKKMKKVSSIENDEENQDVEEKEIDISLSNSSMRMFVTAWKEACKNQTVAEVLEKMLQFYIPRDPKRAARQAKRMKLMFSSYPFVGLLNIAVTSIKSGMWDTVYDTFQEVNVNELTTTSFERCPEYESIDVEPNKQVVMVKNEHIIQQTQSVTVEEIFKKVCTYFEFDQEVLRGAESPLKRIFIFIRKLRDCEAWLGEQFSINEFKHLGHGEFFMFLEKHASLLSTELQKFLSADICEKSPIEATLLQQLLVVLVSQAANNLWENETITEDMISSLLMRQFPFLSFKIVKNGSMKDFLEIVGSHQNDVVSKCVLYSETLCGMCFSRDGLPPKENPFQESTGGISGSVTSKDAIDVLLRTPMLSDLNMWSHWDLVYAPSLGPLLKWLLNEVNTEEFLCLVTKGGKIIRIDHSATADSFLEAAIQGSPFQTALKLISTFALAGGEKHVPSSLLKCHARHAFDVIFKNNIENVEGSGFQNSLMHGNLLNRQQVQDKLSDNSLGSEKTKSLVKIDKAVSHASRFFLDCLGYLPSEFHGFAADILLSGLRSVIKDAPSAILCACNQIEEHLMLHEVGLSLGIMEWIHDYNTFCSTSPVDSFMAPETSCFKAARSEFRSDSRYMHNLLDKLFLNEEKNIDSVRHGKESSEVGHSTYGGKVSEDRSGNCCTHQLSGVSECNNATLIIESIRKEEFGLDPNLSNVESSMLKKQHARLGRALHCLSQELYSQDSHFLLELVQNADDNIYPANVEPTLTVILQELGIIVLNNEQGFSAENIKALCDVGNSTKKGSGAGYIGQKGIGFKSVFRVTDAPEIHSNGFHVKFDISEGQIGFVLPTLVPPCDIEMFSGLASKDPIHLDNKCWNTCIKLPFRSKLSEGTSMSNIVAMFSDLHPSLLLFLHRLQRIVFCNMLNDSLIVMRKEIVGDGIVKVSCGEDRMTWFVASQKLQADVIRRDVQTTEIAIAFTLQESDEGNYNPLLGQQPVFAFLPLRTYGLKFILQGDFVLPSSREEVDTNSPWNQWLLSEFPSLFVGAERSFCDLPCFKENPAKAVTAYMSFVPLVGEVHGFFSCLPRMIISKLRMSSCLLLEGDKNQWVPPCKVLRGWNGKARILLPDSLLHEHLGLGFLNKDIVLTDSLARALGIEEYGPKILVQIVSSLCRKANGLNSVGLGWLSSWLNELHSVLLRSSGQSSLQPGTETDLIDNLRRIPFIPLSDGSFSSVGEGTIWLHSDGAGFDGGINFEAFPHLYAKLRTVSPALLSASAGNISCLDRLAEENISTMLLKVGVQRLSAHDIVKVHILPAISDERIVNKDRELMIDYLCFAMFHLESSCPNCHVEKECIVSELRDKAFILTNHGFKRPMETPIHFSKEFGNIVNINELNLMDIKWHEVDVTYLKHPATESLSHGVNKWRKFFQDIGVTDFVQVVHVGKSITEIAHVISKNIIPEWEQISPGCVADDWASVELVHLLTLLSANVNLEGCKYLLETLDTLWDDCYAEKTTGHCNLRSSGDVRSFKSSFIRSICDVQWAVSVMDNKLHFPKDLFHDCDAVRSILGASAPYTVPKVKSEKLLRDIGLKTEVTIHDILEILKVWRQSEMPFKASVAQMSKLYTCMWNEMAALEQKISEELLAGPFIFVPYASGSNFEEVVSGVFLSPEEVCWQDPTGAIDLIVEMNQQNRPISWNQLPKALCNVYPRLFEFFVKRCGVPEIPCSRKYLQILLQLSTVALPSQAATAVFRVFLNWADGLKSGLLNPNDILHLKECLVKLEYTILPTPQDRWVSLHSSFGLVCWCDDKKLRKRFKHLDGICFLYFGNFGDDEEETLCFKLSTLMQTLGIPALSQLVTRKAIYREAVEGTSHASLLNWALPYAQRYIFSMHPDRYSKLKQSEIGNLKQLQVAVVEKLFYRNVIEGIDGASKKQYECSCLLQGNILYTSHEADSHSIYMELSRLFFDGNPELHLANFLHMITTMAESGSNEEQTEFFILNSQKIPVLPFEEPVWSLSSATLPKNSESLQASFDSPEIYEHNSSICKKKYNNWPPVDWKTAPGFNYARAHGLRTQAACSQPSSSSKTMNMDVIEDIEIHTRNLVPAEIDSNLSSGDDLAITSNSLILPDAENIEEIGLSFCQNGSSADVMFDSINPDIPLEAPQSSSSNFSSRDRLNTGPPSNVQALRTGKLGELAAYKHLSETFGKTLVRWVNENKETGLPYDIVIDKGSSEEEYVEVKATRSARKDWFNISMREWQFAVEKGESFSVAHVVLLSDNNAKVTVYKNLVKLCQLGMLQLVVMMPRQRNEMSVFT